MSDIYGSRRLRVLEVFLRIVDPLVALASVPAGALLRLTREVGSKRLPLTREALRRVGVFPIRSHYYDPQFDFADDALPGTDRDLPGIDLNVDAQRSTLESFVYADELRALADGFSVTPEAPYSFDNGNFGAGDAEVWYQLLRATKPRRIIEIGSGMSTLIAVQATRTSQADDPGYVCDHTCVEPYEMPWLEKTGVTVDRRPVEAIDLAVFDQLEAGDVLFIDSSHMIRPEGDVLVEYLQILPRLAPGVIVHVHDIFTPRNYPTEMFREKVLFWNEQYVLEAFLTHNDQWEVMLAVNHLHHLGTPGLRAACPLLEDTHEPGSFYLRRR